MTDLIIYQKKINTYITLADDTYLVDNSQLGIDESLVLGLGNTNIEKFLHQQETGKVVKLTNENMKHMLETRYSD